MYRDFGDNTLPHYHAAGSSDNDGLMATVVGNFKSMMTNKLYNNWREGPSE